MTDKIFRVVSFVFLIGVGSTAQWLQSYCQDSICLYFNGTNIRRSSNDDADSVCSQYGLRLLEIPNESVQNVVDAATSSWDNYARPLIGFYFRINLVQNVGSWTWITNGQPLDTRYSIQPYPYFGVLNKNTWGISYSPDFEKNTHSYICSYSGSCTASGFQTTFDSDTSTCIVVFDTQKNWFDSRSSCQVLGGDLVTVNQSSPWISQLPNGTYWVGLTMANYVWKSTGKVSNFYKWRSDQPMQGYDCTFITHSDHRGKNFWAKEPCNGDRAFICMNGTAEETSPITPPQPMTSKIPVATSSTILPKASVTVDKSEVATTSGGTQIEHFTQSTTELIKSGPAGGAVVAIAVLGAILFTVLLSIVCFFACRKILAKKEKTPTYDVEIVGARDTHLGDLENRYDELEHPQTLHDEVASEDSAFYSEIEDKIKAEGIYDELSEEANADPDVVDSNPTRGSSGVR